MNPLAELVRRCKCGVHLTVNEHRDYYQPLAQYLEERRAVTGDLEISAEILSEMIATNTCVQLQFYPETPIGSYCIYHHDVEAALREALEILSDEQVQGR